jgi:CelD/BcsL family acetyltransferase involved in cellulose biosynthesis
VVLLSYVIQDAIARGRPRFDFLRGEERYKFEFGPVSEPVHAITIGGRP